MHTYADALQHLDHEPGLSFHVERAETNRPDLRWYAAFRDPDADELTPERGWGEGPTAEEAIDAAVTSFRCLESERGR